MMNTIVYNEYTRTFSINNADKKKAIINNIKNVANKIMTEKDPDQIAKLKVKLKRIGRLALKYGITLAGVLGTAYIARELKDGYDTAEWTNKKEKALAKDDIDINKIQKANSGLLRNTPERYQTTSLRKLGAGIYGFQERLATGTNPLDAISSKVNQNLGYDETRDDAIRTEQSALRKLRGSKGDLKTVPKDYYNTYLQNKDVAPGKDPVANPQGTYNQYNQYLDKLKQEKDKG